MEPGIITLIGLSIWVVLAAIFPELLPKFRTLTPLEQNLIYAGHGFALVSVISALLWFLPWLQQVFQHAGYGIGLALFLAGDAHLQTDFSNLQPVFDSPGAHWPIIVAAALFAYGLVRFVQGVRFCWGCGDGSQRVRALFKTAFGIGGGWFLWRHQDADTLSNEWLAYGWIVLFVVCLWWTLTGAMRFFLTTVGGSNALGILRDFLRRKNAPMRPVTAVGTERDRSWIMWVGERVHMPVAAGWVRKVFNILGWTLGLLWLAAVVGGAIIQWPTIFERDATPKKLAQEAPRAVLVATPTPIEAPRAVLVATPPPDATTAWHWQERARANSLPRKKADVASSTPPQSGQHFIDKDGHQWW